MCVPVCKKVPAQECVIECAPKCHVNACPCPPVAPCGDCCEKPSLLHRLFKKRMCCDAPCAPAPCGGCGGCGGETKVMISGPTVVPAPAAPVVPQGEKMPVPQEKK
jgi:hypothetical protein